MYGPENALRRPSVSTSSSGDPHGTPVRTLVVDDDDEIRGLFTTVLRRENYEVTSASSAEDALALIGRDTFDIMLVDISMPQSDSFDLLSRVHALAPDLPIILISADADIAMARRALEAGACDFISKPCHEAELPIVVERNLTRETLSRYRNQRHHQELMHS